jgi:hypothetical protein
VGLLHDVTLLSGNGSFTRFQFSPSVVVVVVVVTVVSSNNNNNNNSCISSSSSSSKNEYEKVQGRISVMANKIKKL